MNFLKDSYVVLLHGCSESTSEGWLKSMPINYVYRLRHDHDEYTFYIYHDLKGGSDNGWSWSRRPWGPQTFDSKLKLRAATENEIQRYKDNYHNPVRADKIEIPTEYSIFDSFI